MKSDLPPTISLCGAPDLDPNSSLESLQDKACGAPEPINQSEGIGYSFNSVEALAT